MLDFDEMRKKMVQDEIAELMREGADYDPFKPDNFEEAIRNMTLHSDLPDCAKCMCSKSDRTRETFTSIFGAHLHHAIIKYWYECAEESAEKSVPTVEALAMEAKQNMKDGIRKSWEVS